MLEPKAGLTGGKDWESIGSRIGELETYDDDEQPLPQNVSVALQLQCLRLLLGLLSSVSVGCAGLLCVCSSDGCAPVRNMHARG